MDRHSLTSDHPLSPLGIYLNDHLAGATGGVELLRRMARTHTEGADAPRLAELAREVSEDRRSLRSIMARLGIPEQRLRMALGWLGEKAARVKPNGRLVSRSPLSDVLELEAMRLGVEGKASMWRTLRTLAADEERLDRGEIEDLLRRAGGQAETLEAMRIRTASGALAPG
jgi:hypothetical protein